MSFVLLVCENPVSDGVARTVQHSQREEAHVRS